jgi:hypothetical protein
MQITPAEEFMATFGKPVQKHRLKKAFAKATIMGLMVFGSYQYYTPDSWKDAVGKKVEDVTGSERLGHLLSAEKPPAVTVTVQPPAPK